MQSILKLFKLKQNEDLIYVKNKIINYITSYYDRHNKIIQINPNFNKVFIAQCPICRKVLNIHEYKQIYVNTKCICCYKNISRTVLMSCDHANTCIGCYHKLTTSDEKHYFTFENGREVPVCKKQLDVIVAYRTFINATEHPWSTILSD
jgi:hypothetical protein